MSFDQAFWARFTQTIQQASGQREPVFNPPALPTDIDDAERRMGLTLPADLRAAYLVADGMSGPNEQMRFPLFPPGLRWLPIREVASSWELDRDMERDCFEDMAVLFGDDGQALPSTFLEPGVPTGPFRREAFDRRRVPIARYSTWRIYCDLGPCGSGLRGQLLFLKLEDGEMNCWYAPSIGHYCARLAQLVISWDVQFDQGTGSWVRCASGAELRAAELFDVPPDA